MGYSPGPEDERGGVGVPGDVVLGREARQPDLIDAAQRAQGATETGMSASELLVLRDLFFNGASSISEIVARTDLEQSRLSICIQNHVKRGWVATTTDEADGRETIAQVTDRVKTE